MAILAMESFDLGYLPSYWTGSQHVVSSPVRTGTGAMQPSSHNYGGHNGVMNFPAANEIYVGVAVLPGPSSTSNRFFLCGDGGATIHFMLDIDTPSNTLSIYRGSTEIGSYTSQSIETGVWRYIEAHLLLSDTVGVAQVWLDEQLIIDFSGDTRNGGTDLNYNCMQFEDIMPQSPYSVATWDDLYILDTTGTTNNTRLGDIDVIALRPNGNGSSSQLTGSDGNQVDNYALVDDPGAPSSTDYVSGASAGLTDLYALQDTPANIQQVQAVRVSYDAQKAAAGYAAMSPVIKANGSTTTQPALPLSTTETQYQSSIMETDPTGAGWTKTTLDGAEIGVETA